MLPPKYPTEALEARPPEPRPLRRARGDDGTEAAAAAARSSVLRSSSLLLKRRALSLGGAEGLDGK